ncbi:hypothetical protein PUN28_020929 [Cardiocondyla obscurior]|uniref:Uncharacterized protein n=1 Tax=Cardiocondyla obscurior TaxID=286306 RepID=A0AAW2E9D9_9HYME
MAEKRKKYFRNLPIIFTSSRDMAKKQKKYFRNLATYFLFLPAAEIWPKNKKNIFEILQLSIFTSRDMAKKQKKFLKFCNPRYGRKTKKIFLKFSNIALYAYGTIPSFQFAPADEIWPKNIKNFFNFATYKRNMAEKHKNIFFRFCNVALCALKIDAYGTIPSFQFAPADEIWPKNIKNFLILQHSIHCAAFKKCIRVYSEPSIFTSRRNMAEKHKNIFLKFCNQTKYGQKTKKFFKFCNIALCATKNRCIRVYPSLLFSPADEMAKKQKNFLILQHSIVRQLKKMNTGLFRAYYFYQQPRYGQKKKIF